MKKMHKILVASDLSKQSDCAVQLAHELQQKMGGEVTLVHISDVSPVWDWPATEFQAKNVLGQFQTELNKAIETRLREQMVRNKLESEIMIKFGNSQEELLKVIEASKADILVMGHKGETSFFGIGSFAEKMIASSPIPVLIAKNTKAIKTVSALLDPASFSQASIAYAKNIAQDFHAKAQYLTFIPDLSSEALMNIPFVMPSYKFSEKEKHEITESVKASIVSHSKDISSQDIHVEISTLATGKALTRGLISQKADLAIISKHNRGAVEKLFIGSVSKSVLHEFEGNILVLPA
ncbi:MAG: universal stress protein [Bacteriovoracia bacterium]